jgi:hypothetical protein
MKLTTRLSRARSARAMAALGNTRRFAALGHPLATAPALDIVAPKRNALE